MIRYVAGFMFNPEETQVSLIRKIKPDFLAGKLNAIGGKIEADETPLQAMVREFKEETGVDTPWEIWKEKVKLFKQDEWEVTFFKAKSKLVYDVKSMEEELVAVYSLNNIGNPVPNLDWLLPLVLDKSINKLVTVEED